MEERGSYRISTKNRIVLKELDKKQILFKDILKLNIIKSL